MTRIGHPAPSWPPVTDPATQPGLVRCAISARVGGDGASDLANLWRPAFPTPDLVTCAAGLFPVREPWDGHEGPRPRIVIGPGVIALEAPDLARRERAAERAISRRRAEVGALAAYLTERGAFPASPSPSRSREITEWSRKSRARMVRRLAEIDWSPLIGPGRVPAMITLTYPRDWQTVAPTGRAVKAHLRALQMRWRRAWGTPLIGVWKLEFQRRGAPHVHIFTVPPHGRAGEFRRLTRVRKRAAVGDGLSFREWLSAVWADIVAHPDPEQRSRHLAAGTGVDFAVGLRSSDPRRLAIYFAKHGTYAVKEYQHKVPEAWRRPGHGPGRFWGYWGLKPVTAAVELTWVDYVTLARTLRRHSRAQGSMTVVTVPRVDTRTGVIRVRKVRRRARRFPRQAGFVTVNDGPSMAATLARLLALPPERRNRPGS